MDPIKKYIGTVDYDANLYAIISAVIAIIISTIIFFLCRRRHTSKKSVLITGLSESGKTLLFCKLITSKKVVTYTSMKENIAIVMTPVKKALTLVDVPGNERLRFKYLEQFLPSTRGIIFVIDSLNFPKEIRDVAGFMYSLLQQQIIHKNKIPLLIACNKQDHAVAKSAKVIQSQLEKEMNALRVTQTGKLASISAGEEKLFLGIRGKDFQFGDLKLIKVELSECSALEPGDGKPDEILLPIWNWLSRIA